jgi:Tfp pilus assembly protein PilF
MFFAVHPVAVYGVAYLTERSIVMAALFSVLAMHTFFKGLTGNRQHYLLLSTLCYLLAVLSKEYAVMLPAAIAAITVAVRRPSGALLRTLMPTFTIYLLIMVWTVLTRKGILGDVYVYEPFSLDMLSVHAENTVGFNAKNAYLYSILMEGALFFKYLWLWLLPYVGWMSVDMRVHFPGSLFSWPYTVAFLGFAAYPLLAVKLLLRGNKSGLAGFAMLFPWLMFFTEFSTMRIQEPFVLYRSYLWMVALPAILPAFFSTCPPRRVNIIMFSVVLVLAASALNRLDSFSDSLKLWDDVVKKNSDTALGVERGYLNRGQYKHGRRPLIEELEDYNRAIQLNPKYYFAYSNRANVYFAMKRDKEAMQDLERAIEIKPDYPTPYIRRGTYNLRSDKFQEAIVDFEKAIANPKTAKNYRVLCYNNRGVAYMKMGNNDGALHDFDTALKLDPASNLAIENRKIVMDKINNGRQSADR